MAEVGTNVARQAARSRRLLCTALGGCGLPSYAASISALNDIVDGINNMFD